MIKNILKPGLLSVLIIATMLFSANTAIMSQNLASDQIAINNIAMNDFLEDREIVDGRAVLNDNERFKTTFIPRSNSFTIVVLQNPYSDNLRAAETDLLQILNITQNEACFLNIDTIVPRSVNPEGGRIDILSFCKEPNQFDVILDKTINGLDYAQCISEYDSVEEDLTCDFNVNRRIDALDLSRVIQYLGKDVE